ncbi:unnamed protein product [marine sediment metagenome]|uniref:Uncharacterized protein n=1 Tax=marine sediment metagenome TaxID=412755 RepID=X0UQI4_9ZZZZ
MNRKTATAPLQEWAQRTPALLVDRDAWPIRKTAEVSCRRKRTYARGAVTDTYLDHRQRPVVEVSTEHGTRYFRPEEVRVVRRKR